MAIELSLVDTKQNIAGDNVSRHYKATITGTYPASGYEVSADDYPDDEAVFSKIKRVLFSGGCMDENGVIYRADPDDFDNSDSDDPTFTIKAYDMETGGAGYAEVSTGQALSGNFHIVVEGIPANGVDSEPW